MLLGFLCGCQVLVNPMCYPWTHLCSMTESFNPVVVSLQSILADEHQMLGPLSPLLYSCFSHKQSITVILSSPRPPAARPARLPVYPLTLILLRQDVVSFVVCSQEKFKKEIFSLGAHVPANLSLWPSAWFECDLVLLSSQDLVRGWCFPHEESVLWRQIDLQGQWNQKAF